MCKKNYYKLNPEKYKKSRKQHYLENREQTLIINKEWRDKNKESVRKKIREWQMNNPEKKSEYAIANRRRNNGFSRELFNKILTEQNKKCAICSVELEKGLTINSACADHCHTTNKPRGILCKKCNLMLGHAKDDISILTKAILYLDFYREFS